MFQFQYGAIDGNKIINHCILMKSFNSSMVQLTEVLVASMMAPASSFNSSMVQLTVFSWWNSQTFNQKFQFQYGAIDGQSFAFPKD